MKNNSEYSAIIIGAGVATGSALTKKFAKEGYKVCPVRRGTNASDLKDLEEEIKQDGGWAQGFEVDARDEDAIKKLFKEADEILGFSISNIILEGPKEKLDLTENTQPAIFLLGYSTGSIAAMYTGVLDDRIAGMACFSGWTPLRDTSKEIATGGNQRLWNLHA